MLQRCLDLICNWATSWQLKLSPSKCTVLSLGKTHVNTLYHCCDVVTDLVILIYNQLSFSPHIDTVCTKTKQRAALILNCFYSRNKYLLIRAFIAHVRPLLEYCCSVWSPSKLGLIDKLENVQRRFNKRLHGLQHLSYSERLTLLKIYSLECRRINADIIIYFLNFTSVN